jgi:hypothetical protein
MFHGLIRARAREAGIAVPSALPQIEGPEGSQAEPLWYALPGFYGGFAYWLEWREDEPMLHAQSWCRVMEGSGMYHTITVSEIRLIEEGFV